MKLVYWCFLLSNAAIYASSAFLPLLGVQLGLDYFQIGLVGAAFWLGSMFSNYFFGRLADSTGRKTMFVKWGFAFATICFFLQLLISNFASFLALRLLAGLATGIFAYPLLSLAARHDNFKREIGVLAAFGALGVFGGYAAAALIGDARMLFLVSGVFFLCGFALSLKIASVRTYGLRVPFFPAKILKKNFELYSSYFLRHLGANAVWLVLPLFLSQLGASSFWIGVIIALNPLAQYFLMRKLGEHAQARGLDEKRIFRWGTIASALAFAAYLFIPNFWLALPIALVIALSWSWMYVGSMVYLASNNAEKATSTSVLGSLLSLSTVLGSLAGGAISQQFGLRATFVFAILLCAASLLASKEL